MILRSGYMHKFDQFGLVFGQGLYDLFGSSLFINAGKPCVCLLKTVGKTKKLFAAWGGLFAAWWKNALFYTVFSSLLPFILRFFPTSNIKNLPCNFSLSTKSTATISTISTFLYKQLSVVLDCVFAKNFFIMVGVRS